MLNEQIRANWLEGGSKLWYRLEAPGGKHHWMLVDTQTAEKSPLFDHARLAAALSGKLGREIHADELPIERLEISGESLLLLLSDGGAWSWDVRKSTLAPQDTSTAGKLAIPRKHGPARSTHTGPATQVIVVNRTQSEIRLVWHDESGQAHDYGSIPAGGRHVQPTFEGHVWEILNAQHRRLGLYEAAREPGMILIDNALQANRDAGNVATRPAHPDPARHRRHRAHPRTPAGSPSQKTTTSGCANQPAARSSR